MKTKAAWAVAALLVAHPGAVRGQSTPAAALDRAAELVQGARYGEAKALAEPIARSEPGNARAAYLAARAHAGLRQPDSAATLIERAVETAPRNSEYQLWLGRIRAMQGGRAGMLRAAGFARRAKAAWERAVELDPGNLDARAELVAFHLVAPGIMGGDRSRAQAEAEEIRRRDEWRGQQELARVRIAMGDSAAGELLLLSAIRARPDSAKPRIAVALLYQNSGRFEDAYVAVEPLLSGSVGRAEALFQVGRIGAVSGGSLDRAESALREYLLRPPPADAPSHASAHWRLGMIMEHRRDTAAARREYQAALRLDPEHAQARAALSKLP